MTDQHDWVYSVYVTGVSCLWSAAHLRPRATPLVRGHVTGCGVNNKRPLNTQQPAIN